MTNKKIVFNLTLKDLKDLLLINKVLDTKQSVSKTKLKKSKKKKNKKIIDSLFDTKKKSSDHMKASYNNFNNTNNLMNENLYLKNEELKRHQLLINNEDALKLNPLIRNNNIDDFKIKVDKYNNEFSYAVGQHLFNLDNKIEDKIYELDNKLNKINDESSEKFKDYDKVKDNAVSYFKNLNTTLTPQSIDSSNVVPVTSGSDEFTEGQNINPPPNPTLGQINEEKQQTTTVRDEVKKGRGRPKQILTEEERKDQKVKKMSETEKRLIFRNNATAEEKEAYHRDSKNINLLNEIIKNHI